MAMKLSAEQSVNKIVDTVHKMAQSHIASQIGIGIVINDFPDLKIAWNNIILDKNQIYVACDLLKGYGRACNGEISQKNIKGKIDIESAKGNIRTNTQPKRGGTDKPSFVSHSHKINDDYKADLEGEYEAEDTSDYYNENVYIDFGLTAGDLVSLLIVEGGQNFIVLNKIVYLADIDPEIFEDEEDGDDEKPFPRLF